LPSHGRNWQQLAKAASNVDHHSSRCTGNRAGGEIMDVGSVKRIHQSDWTKAGVRFLRARDIVSAYKNEDAADILYISQAKYDEYSVLSGKVELGDLLVTGVGTIGIPYLITKIDPVYFKDGNIIWFKNNGTLNGDFFYYSFIGERIQEFIKESAGTGTVGTYTISSGKDTPLNSPLLEEQKKIGTYFRTLDELISQHATQLQKLQQIKSACLERMFV
jgi:type I restriction enzyme S subunit